MLMTHPRGYAAVDAAPETPPDLDPVRRLVVDRCRELRLTLADASRRIGRNESYVHQFVYRGSPKRLPEDTRIPLAQLLDLPESQLRPASILPASDGPMVHAPHITGQFGSQPVQPQADVPVFAPGDPIDIARATEWTHRPPLLSGAGPLFARWVTEDTGRFHDGDMVIVRLNQPPRVGDPVVVLRGMEIIAIGDLVTRAGEIIVRVGNSERRFPATECRALKIAAAAFP